ncbi:MAG: hypothetical protein Q8O55_01685 [Dehalococcoidales bacterium]|nr:hypothetical protein [Dehalococcoidales bacterium]
MVMLKHLPKWSTPNRQAELVKLFVDSGGFCVFGHQDCLIPSHHYEYYIERLIAIWKADDRELDTIVWEAERQALHALNEPRYREGRFGTISREIFYGSQPLFYIEALGMSGVKLQPFAKVRLPSSYLRLNVDLGDSLKGISKNKRRKAIRHGKPLPARTEAEVFKLVLLAVRHYLNI